MMLNRVFIVIAVLMLGACGGGSSSDPGLPPTPSPIGTGTSDYLFYKDEQNKLIAFDPDNRAKTLVSLATVRFTSPIIDGTYNGTTGSVSNLGIKGVLYFENNHFYKIMATKVDGHVAHQVSTFSSSQPICADSQSGKLLIFTTGGTDNNCATLADNSGFIAIHQNMTSADAPISLTVKPVTEMTSIDGTLTGWISLEAGEVIVRDAAFANPKSVASGVVNVGNVYISPVGYTALLIDNNLRFYNHNTGSLSASRHSTTNIIYWTIASGKTLYFFDGSTLYSVDVTGNTNALPIMTDSLGYSNLVPRFIQGDYLVFTAENPATAAAAIRTARLSDGIVSSITETHSDVINYLGSAGNDVYYTRTTGTRSAAGHGTADNSIAAVDIIDSTWIGYSLPTSNATTVEAVNSYPLGQLIMANFVYSNNLVSSFSLTQYIPSGYVPAQSLGNVTGFQSGLFIGGGNQLLGILVTDTSNSDIFYVDATVANSVVNITDTPDVNELTIFF